MNKVRLLVRKHELKKRALGNRRTVENFTVLIAQLVEPLQPQNISSVSGLLFKKKMLKRKYKLLPQVSAGYRGSYCTWPTNSSTHT